MAGSIHKGPEQIEEIEAVRWPGGTSVGLEWEKICFTGIFRGKLPSFKKCFAMIKYLGDKLSMQNGGYRMDNPRISAHPWIT